MTLLPPSVVIRASHGFPAVAAFTVDDVDRRQLPRHDCRAGIAPQTFPTCQRPAWTLWNRLVSVWLRVALLAVLSAPSVAAESAADDSTDPPATDVRVPDPSTAGGESDSIVQVANLIYAGTKSSQCFSDHFLVAAEQDSAISTSRRFHAVKTQSEEIFEFPLLIMTGEGTFQLSEVERRNLRRYLNGGGFLLASAGCSSTEWNESFRQEMRLLYPEQNLEQLGMQHPIFNTVYEIRQLSARHGTPNPLEGVTLNGRLAVVFSQDGLNDTEHTQGCCCCGGNEITNCVQINVNILAYALVY